jgi:plasmid stabilization system protein ParE
VNVRLLGAAQAEAIDIADRYDVQVPGLGDQFFAALDALVGNLTVHPRLYARVRRAPANREVREGRVSGFPIVAVYELTATEALILSITHGRRSRKPWRQRLP